MANEYKGSCLCGDIQFSVSRFSEKVANCHCSMCRKFHGAAFGTLVSVENLNWLSGKHLLKDFIASNGTTRTFCFNCGSSLGFRIKNDPIEKMELAIATFDCDIPVLVNAQIYTNSKANWCVLQSNITTWTEGR